MRELEALLEIIYAAQFEYFKCSSEFCDFWDGLLPQDDDRECPHCGEQLVKR